MPRLKGSKNLSPSGASGFDRHINIAVTRDEYARITSIAERAQLTLAEFGRRALHDAALAVSPNAYFYVRLPDGAYHPLRTEPGYEFVENAQRFANRVDGTVVHGAQENQSALGRRPDEGLDSQRVDDPLQCPPPER